MDPVIATGLINLGSNIISKALPVTSVNPQQSSDTFANELIGFQDKAPNAIHDLKDIKTKLLDCSEVKAFLSKNKGNSITLDQMSDGSIRFLASSGDFMTLSKQSESCLLANQFLHCSIQSGANINPQRPNSVILTG